MGRQQHFSALKTRPSAIGRISLILRSDADVDDIIQQVGMPCSW